MKKVIYLCHPYSSPDPEVMKARFKNANRLAALLMQHGYVVFSPLSHSVPIADEIDNHQSYEFWLGQDLPMLRLCDEVWVPLIDGWDKSKGIDAELEEAHRLFKPVVYFRFQEGQITSSVDLKRCVHQVSRPKVKANRPPGWGDCSDCMPDDKNGRCPGYCPVEVSDYEVEP